MERFKELLDILLKTGPTVIADPTLINIDLLQRNLKGLLQLTNTLTFPGFVKTDLQSALELIITDQR